MPFPDNNDQQMTWFERHVCESLDELKNTHKDFLQEFKVHCASDVRQFEALRLEVATTKAAHDAVANSKAKLWGAVGAGISLLLSSAVHFFGHK